MVGRRCTEIDGAVASSGEQCIHPSRSLPEASAQRRVLPVELEKVASSWSLRQD